MRYLFAMILALFTALAVIIFAASPTAHWVVNQFPFDSPDEVSNMFDAVFIGLGLLGMLIGWGIGWTIGAAFEKKPDLL